MENIKLGCNTAVLCLKPISRAVLNAEILDILTTLSGFALFPQVLELNPLPGLLGGMFPTILIKILATILVIMVLESVEKWPRVVWMVPAVAALPVFWNVVNLVFELLSRTV